MPKDAVAVVEAAYSLADDDRAWLRQLSESMTPLVDDGLGVISFFFDTRRPTAEWIQNPVSVPFNGDFEKAILAVHLRRTEADRVRPYLQSAPISTSSEIYASRAEQHAPAAEAAAKLGFADFLRVQAKGSEPFGCVIGAPLRRASSIEPRRVVRFRKITEHITAGLRLRRAAAETTAILDADGVLQHTTEELTKNTREALRDAACSIDRARASMRRHDPERALSTWRSLVRGEFTLVDRFDRDGRRFWLVHRNRPELPDPRGLTAREWQVAALVSRGASNKAIADALGTAEGTVAAHVDALRTKLGARSRAELVERSTEPHAARETRLVMGRESLSVISEQRHVVGTDDLTRAELDVARAAARGASNDAIAKSRGTSIRTVANQLQSVFDKLAIGSRAELARRMNG